MMAETALKITIVIPTVDRVEPLLRAVRGCVAQCAAVQDCEVIVVDNSADGRQAKVLDGQFAATVRYVHEPRAGLAYARNRGVAESNAQFIAFLDDDEVPRDGWLASLLRALEDTGADAAFGSVLPVFETPPERLAGFARALHTRRLAAGQHQDVSGRFNYLGTGNSCFRTATCFTRDVEPFDRRFNQSGGEDTDLLRRLVMAGRKLVWAEDAIVEEFVPESRTTAAAMAARRFSQGQMRTFSHVASVPRRFDKAGFWMAAGAAQYAAHTVLAAANSVVGRTESADIHRIQAQGGLGKVLWQPRFRKKRYGAPQ